MKALNLITCILVIVGAINWGLVGAFDFNLIGAIFGKIAMLEKLIYIVVGLAGIYNIFIFQKCCK